MPPAPIPEGSGDISGHDHGVKSREAFGTVTPEVARRIHKLETDINCACPRENWSRTLSHCPDACADQQKLAIRRDIDAGLTDQEIKENMRNQYGSKVLAAPQGGSGEMVYYIPGVMLALAAVVAVGVLLRWHQGGARARTQREEQSMLASDEEIARVERELEGLE